MRNCLPIIAFLLMILPLRAENETQSQSDELNRIKQNYTQYLLFANAESPTLFQALKKMKPENEISDQAVVELHQFLPSDLKKTNDYVQAINPDGSWPDINYQDSKRSGWEPKIHAERILELTRLYATPGNDFYHSEKIAATIHQALNFWFTKKLVCLNWWYNEIGIPKTMGSAFILFEDQLTQEEKMEAIRVMNQCQFGRTGQNKVWQAGNVLTRALFENNYTLAKEARDNIFSEIVTNQPEGIKNDWSFHQHGPQQQFGNYGLSFISSMSFYSELFVGTTLALDQKQLSILNSFLEGGYRWILWHGYMDINGLDRQLFHNAQIHKTLTVAYSAQGLAKSGQPTCLKTNENILNENFTSAKNTFTGHKHFWESDQTIHRRPEWMASVKMASSRVIGTELVNEDNLKGFYMGDGATYTYEKGNEYLNVFPFWDWRKIPGVTAYESNLPFPQLKGNNPRNKSTFVGGVTDGKWGMTAMELNRDGLKAHKVWVFTDHFVLCLGAGIQTDSNLVVTTAMDQRLKKQDLLQLDKNKWNAIKGRQTFNGKNQRFFHDQTGYIVLKNAKITAISERRAGQWVDFMGMYKPEKVEGEIISLHLDHGTRPKDATYEYLILPASDKESTAAFDLSALKILCNDTTTQAVALPKEKVYFVTTYRPVSIKLASGLDFSAGTAGIYLIRETGEGNKIWYTDPTHSLSQASITLNGKSRTIDLPTGDEKGKSVSFQ